MSAHIHHGPWINWSHGLIRGATVTLTERQGGLLTAFIATFVTIVGAELWKIICYILHQARSSPGPQDGLYHQQQVLLRTSPNPGGAAWLFLRQTWSWAGKARLAVLRTLPWAVFGVTYMVVIGITAIFSSEISKSPGPERLLVAPESCGLWRLNTSSPDALSAYQAKTLNDSIVAATYARACYGGSNAPLQCGKLPVPALKYTVNRNATCPFQSGLCYYGDTAAFSMTTGMLDSHLDLGINSRKEHRMLVEKSTTCAPLHEKGYATYVNATDENNLGWVGDTVAVYNYGVTINYDGTITNNTYYYDTRLSALQYGYSLSAYQALAGQGQTGGVLVPIPALNTTNADLSLLFIAANSIAYQQPVDDPVFAAHIHFNDTLAGTYVDFYDADEYVSVVGCSEQYRACNPINNVCTARLGFIQLQEALVNNKDGLELNYVQNATITRIESALQLSSVYYATYGRGGSALRATEVLQQTSSGALPNNQWQIEVSSWFDTSLARIQQKVQEYAIGPAFVPSGSYVQPPNPTLAIDAPWLDFCVSQIVNDSSDTMSFSVLGLALLFVLGGIIILTSLTIDTIVGYIQYKTGKGLHARMEWLTNDKLQLQRLLFQEMKLGNWSDDPEHKIPTTTVRDDKFVSVADKHVDFLMRERRSGEEDGAGVQFIQEYSQDKGR